MFHLVTLKISLKASLTVVRTNHRHRHSAAANHARIPQLCLKMEFPKEIRSCLRACIFRKVSNVLRYKWMFQLLFYQPNFNLHLLLINHVYIFVGHVNKMLVVAAFGDNVKQVVT